ncbi:hypothetical protein [Kiloniella sp.]|uniref:hypothetical protein n=1 Tax=Kiloniella sp. TaxID=1938587 RepID=UPI003A904A5A
MKLYQVILPATALLLSSLVSNVAIAKSAKGKHVQKPHIVKSHKYVPPAQKIKKSHGVKRKRPIQIIYTQKKLKQRHFYRLTSLQRARFENAFISAVSISDGRAFYWNANGVSGAISVFNDSYQNNGCRSYRHTVKINGKLERVEGLACKQVNGSWEIIS